MTIVVTVAVPDGLIMAAESRTTYMDGERTRVTSDATQKVFRICEGNFGVSCYGMALYKDKTVAGHMNDFEASLEPAPEDVDELVCRLGTWFQDSLLAAHKDLGEPWTAPMSWDLGFHVAGYDKNGIGKVYDVQVPGRDGAAIALTDIGTTNIGVIFEGQTGAIRRLLGGVDSDALEAQGVEVSAELGEALSKLEYRLLFPHTLQDAIDCASFLIKTTIGMQRFSDGIMANPGSIPACGGAIQVLAITRKRSEWISRLELESPV